MLFELHIKYKDGQTDRPLVYVETGGEIKIYPEQDNILAAGCRRFRYHVPKHAYLPVSIVRLNGKTLISPSMKECHPQTTLEDIIESKPKIKGDVQIKEKIKESKQTWEFNSSSGDGKYIVTKVGDIFKCTCPGSWRSKDKKCKHIKEVEQY
jgi:hypothetical protein